MPLVVERPTTYTPNVADRPFFSKGVITEIARSRDRELIVEGPADCVAGETRIYEPLMGEHTAIADLWWERRAPIVLTQNGPRQGGVPFVKGFAPLYRVTLEDGRSFLGTARHRVETEEGWAFVSHLSPGQKLRVAEPSPQVSSQEPDRVGSPLGAHYLTDRQRDCQGDCSPDHRQDGERLRWDRDSVLASLPSRAGVLGRSRVGQRGDDRGDEAGYSRPCPSFDHRATSDYSSLSVEGQRAQFLALERTSGYGACLRESDGPSRQARRLLLPTSEAAIHSERTLPHSASASLDSTSLDSSSTDRWITVSSIAYERTDVYFDLTVPDGEHYLAEGIWHHNTGKSRGCLEKLHAAMTKYPGARGAMIRKTRKSLRITAQATYEQHVCPDGASRLWNDEEYRYPNKSKIYLLGMDDPEKVKSLELDMAYVQEVSELSIEDWEILTTRVTGRGAVMPYTQILADMNPVDPNFWLYQREAAGSCRFLQARHEDNPSITPERIEALDRLTGYRYKRLRLGLRVAAEGMYFEEWDPDVHLVEHVEIGSNWPRWITVDYGFAVPFCCLWLTRCPETRRIYAYREVYAAGVRDELQADAILRANDGERLALCVGDPSMFAERREVGLPSVASSYIGKGIPLQPGTNNRKQGWATVRRTLAHDEGPPRLQIVRSACPNLVRTLPAMVRDPLDPEDLADAVKGVKTEDHACFPDSTWVSTPDGGQWIRDIRAGDWVDTPRGPRRVVDCGMTNAAADVFAVETEAGIALRGTGNHPIYVKGKGFIPIDALRYGDIMVSVKEASKWPLIPLSSTGSSFDAIRIPRVGPIPTTTSRQRAIRGTVWATCIRKSGKAFTARFPKVSTFTTVTAILSTMIRRIWKRNRALSTIQTTGSNVPLPLRRLSTSQLFDLLPLCGTSRQKDVNGIGSTDGRLGRIVNRWSAPAASADHYLRPLRDATMIASAQTPVSRSGGGKVAVMTKIEPAVIAAQPSERIITKTRDSVRGVALVVTGIAWSSREAVYNLTVEDAHCYFADGILVSNCDALRYGLQAEGIGDARVQEARFG